MKILIMKFRNIGDVLLTTPLIKNLKLQYPDALIDVAVNKGTQDMLTLNPNINEVIIYDRENIKSLSFFQKIKEELKFLIKLKKNKYDISINTTRGDRGALLSFFSFSKTKIGYKSKKKNFSHFVFNYDLPKIGARHMVDSNLDPLEILGKKILEKKVEIFWEKKDDIIVDEIIKNNFLENQEFIHIHPVSRWMFKCIGDDIMAQIIDYCQIELNKKVVITASPEEKEIKKVQDIIKLCNSDPINLTSKLTLKQVATLNKRSKFFIGVDTAIMHMSAANDIPVIAFFGPTAAFHWGPWDNDLMINGYVDKKGFQKMGKHTVIQENWDCIPCDKDGCNGSKKSDCLFKFDISIIKNIINSYNK